MLTTLTYLFAFVFVLSLVVVIHEGGHFYVARLCGVHVTDFSIGFGRELWSRVDKKGTRWKICAIPLGGYVKMLGDEDAASAKSSVDNIQEDMIKYTFMAQPLWKRAAIIFAGPGMNYVFAIVLLTGMIFALGEVIAPPVVGEVKADSPAAEAGLEKGDRILSINGEAVAEFTDIQRIVRITEFEKPLSIVLDRNGTEKKVSLLPRVMEGADYPIIGVTQSVEVMRVNNDLNIFQSFGLAVRDVYRMTKDTLIYLGQVLFKHRSAKDMRGPLGIAEASGDALQGGWISLLMFIVQISIAVGFMNLLPVPVLDGGHLAFYIVEAIRGKPLPEKAQNGFLIAGMSLLCLLLVYTMFLDVPRIIQRVKTNSGVTPEILVKDNQ